MPHCYLIPVPAQNLTKDRPLNNYVPEIKEVWFIDDYTNVFILKMAVNTGNG